jgi:hypothetical protein
MKKVIVFLDKDRYEMEVDSEEFEDYKLEACTRIIERLFSAGNFKVPAIMFCEEVAGKKTKYGGTYNTYKLIINAGYHSKAELLRKICLKEDKIDWANEPIQSSK